MSHVVEDALRKLELRILKFGKMINNFAMTNKFWDIPDFKSIYVPIFKNVDFISFLFGKDLDVYVKELYSYTPKHAFSGG